MLADVEINLTRGSQVGMSDKCVLRASATCRVPAYVLPFCCALGSVGSGSGSILKGDAALHVLGAAADRALGRPLPLGHL